MSMARFLSVCSFFIVLVAQSAYAYDNDEGSAAKEDVEYSDFNIYKYGYMWGRYFREGPVFVEIPDFLEGGFSPEDAAKFLLDFFVSSERDRRGFKNNISDYGYKFEEKGDGAQLSCSDKFIKENETHRDIYAFNNRALLKARDILLSETGGNRGENAEFYFFIGLSYLLEDGLNDFYAVKDNFKKYLQKTSRKFAFLSDWGYEDKDKIKIMNLVETVAALPDDADIENVLITAKEKGFFEKIAFTNGFFDFYNDGFYQTASIVKVNELSVLLTSGASLLPDGSHIYPRYFQSLFKGGGMSEIEPSEYPAFHCTDNVYNGRLYIVPFKEITFIVNMSESEGLIKSVEMRNPKFFNTRYGKNYYAPEIFKNDTKKEKLHGIYGISSFSYDNNMFFKYNEEKEPLSPLGNADIAKDRRGRAFMAYESNRLGSTRFMKKGRMEDLESYYMAYLSRYTDKTLIDGSLRFYDIDINNHNNSTILAAADFYNDNDEKKEILFAVDRKSLDIKNKELAAMIDKEASDAAFYKNIVYSVRDKGADAYYLAMVRDNNTIAVFNMVNGKIGHGEFHVYSYKSRMKETVWKGNMKNGVPDKQSFFSLNPGFDCAKEADNTVRQVICSDRGLIVTKSYIDLLFQNIMDKAAANSYPESVIGYYQNEYDNMLEDLAECSISDDDMPAFHNAPAECYLYKMMQREAVFK